MSKTSSLEFGFEIGDRVLVRVREHGNSGNIKAKFEADVDDIREGVAGSSPTAVLNPPWDSIGGVSLRPYEAEFEVLDDDE